jgi:polyisoprenoid-binding protein YceI
METTLSKSTLDQAVGTRWQIDPLHSEILFKIKHLVISTVTGSFQKFQGEMVANEKEFDGATINLQIDVKSISTGQEARDTHLKTSDFFEAETYPTIQFQSTAFDKTETAGIYRLTGKLTLKGVTKEVELTAEYGGSEKDHYGNTKIGFEVSGVINRKEFGLSFNSLTETGGLALGENVKLIGNVQLVKG